MSAIYCLIALVGLIATYLFVIYLKEYAREEKSVKELLKAQEKFASGGMPLYFDIDPQMAKDLMKTYSQPAPATKKTTKTEIPTVEQETTKKKIIN